MNQSIFMYFVNLTVAFQIILLYFALTNHEHVDCFGDISDITIVIIGIHCFKGIQNNHFTPFFFF